MKTIYFISGIVIIVIITALFISFNMKVNINEQQSGITTITEINNFKNINSKELENMMADKDFTLINVHIPYAGDIENTDVSIPYNKIGELINLEKDEKIVLYCRSGSMSKTAAETLVKLGYTNVYNFQYGMNEWKQSGNKLVFNNN